MRRQSLISVAEESQADLEAELQGGGSLPVVCWWQFWPQ